MEDALMMWYPQRRGNSLKEGAARIQAAAQLRTSNAIAEKERRKHSTVEEEPLTIPVPADIKDLTGSMVGKLTVIGFFRRVSPARMNLWRVQCECGAYAVRRERWIKNPKDDGYETCDDCRAT